MNMRLLSGALRLAFDSWPFKKASFTTKLNHDRIDYENKDEDDLRNDLVA